MAAPCRNSSNTNDMKAKQWLGSPLRHSLASSSSYGSQGAFALWLFVSGELLPTAGVPLGAWVQPGGC